MNNFKFNYIITIHNKEFLIKDVIVGVISKMGSNSTVYAVLDGCSDNSELIIDALIVDHPGSKIVKLYANDVHELKSINVGLKSSSQDGKGFNIILQDDVILSEPNIESKCINLYNQFKNLGIVSFRHGGNISRSAYKKKIITNLIYRHVENECGHFPNQLSMLKNGIFTFREIAIKSPICIPFNIVREVGMPDERYAPWDDVAFCYQVIKAGYHNGVFALDFQSDVSWGTTRKKIQKTLISEVEYQNLKRFKADNPTLIPLNSKIYNNQNFKVFDTHKKYNIEWKTLFRDVKSKFIKVSRDYIKHNW